MRERTSIIFRKIYLLQVRVTNVKILVNHQIDKKLRIIGNVFS